MNAYVGYRYVVFRSRGRILTELPRFSLVYLATLVANILILPIALQVMPFSIYVVEAVFTLAVVISSYLGHKYFSFRRRAGRRTARGVTSLLEPFPNDVVRSLADLLVDPPDVFADHARASRGSVHRPSGGRS